MAKNSSPKKDKIEIYSEKSENFESINGSWSLQSKV